MGPTLKKDKSKNNKRKQTGRGVEKNEKSKEKNIFFSLLVILRFTEI